MTKDNFTTKKREYKHLSDVQRGKLEEMARLGTYTQKEMGAAFRRQSIDHLS